MKDIKKAAITVGSKEGKIYDVKGLIQGKIICDHKHKIARSVKEIVLSDTNSKFQDCTLHE